MSGEPVALPDTDPLDNWRPELIPLSHLVIEGLADTIDELERKLGPDDVWLDTIGRRCTTAARASAMFAERAAKLAAQREANRRKIASQRIAREARRATIKAGRAAEQTPGKILTGNAVLDTLRYEDGR